MAGCGVGNMTLGESIVLYITAAISVLGLVLSIVQLRLEILNRRNALRENLFNRQFDCYLELMNKIVLAEREYRRLINQKINGISELDKLDLLIDGVDFYFTENEFLFPDQMHKITNQFIIDLHNFYKLICSKNTLSITYKEAKDMSKKFVYFQINISKELGIETLSQENRNLARSKRQE